MNICEYVLDRVRARAPHTWRQAPRKPPLSFRASSPSARVVSERHLLGVPELAVRGLWLIDAGFPVEVSSRVPSADHLLELQASGRRCVSLLSSGGPTSELDPLAFVLHDLCHLAKFASSEFYVEQVGFFSTLQRAFAAPALIELESELDPEWHSDRQKLAADMNGSSVFLFAVLKMKLKMAARRRRARLSGAPAKTGGPLDAGEQAAFEGALGRLLDAMELSESVRDAAVLTSARRDCPIAAARLAARFREIGAATLAKLEARSGFETQARSIPPWMSG